VIPPGTIFFSDTSIISIEKGSPFYAAVILYSLLGLITLLAVIIPCFTRSVNPILNAFNVSENYYKIINRKERKSSVDLTFMEGIRALSTLTVIFGHEFILRTPNSSNFSHVFADFSKSYSFVSLIGFFYSVDTFFFLAGFFLSFSVI